MLNMYYEMDAQQLMFAYGFHCSSDTRRLVVLTKNMPFCDVQVLELVQPHWYDTHCDTRYSYRTVPHKTRVIKFVCIESAYEPIKFRVRVVAYETNGDMITNYQQDNSVYIIYEQVEFRQYNKLPIISLEGLNATSIVLQLLNIDGEVICVPHIRVFLQLEC
jgi:hypothetical protein